MVREKVDSLIERGHSGVKAVILGDFNSTPDEQAIKLLLSSKSSHDTLINLSDPLNDEGLGTYRYMGTWEMIRPGNCYQHHFFHAVTDYILNPNS